MAQTGRADLSTDVRYQGQSGKHLLALSFSGFDPKRTFGAFDAICGPVFSRPSVAKC
jgi:hypothetical protein